MRGASRLKWAVASSAAFFAVAQGTSAQDAGGLEATLDFAQGLTHSDVDGVQGRTNLGFDIFSITRSQSLSFALDAALVQDFEDGLSMSVENPSAALSYAIENRQTVFTTDLSYRQSDASGLSEDSDELLGILFLDDGAREDIRGSVGVEFGRDLPFGGTFDLAYQDVSYSDTTSPDLIDTETTSAGLSLRFDIDDRITATLGYDWSKGERDGNRDTLTENLTTGAQLAISPTLDASISVGLTKILVTNGLIETESDGLSFGFDLTQQRPVGSLSFSLDSDLTEAGRRTTAEVSGVFETRRGTLNASVGITENTDNTTRPLLSFSYTEELPRGSFAISLNQNFGSNDLGDETLNSGLTLNWQQSLNRTSRMGTSMTYQITDVIRQADDTERVIFDVSFTHELTEDWSWTSRYTHTYSNGDRRRAAYENEIFFGLETSFGWRP